MLAPSYLPQSKHTLISQLTDGLEPGALSWLSGYFAGVAQAQGVPPLTQDLASVATTPEAATSQRLTVLYGSQTGNAKRLAESLAERLSDQGLDVRLVRADRYATRELKDERLLYIVMSTQGDGDPPDDALAFVEFLNSRRAPKLPQLKYAVLGLGDSSYPFFCGIAQSLDQRLTQLGAQRLHETGLADLDIDTVALPWRDAAITLARQTLTQTEPHKASITALRPKTAVATREHPYHAELLLNQRITGRDSQKDIRHLELSLEGSHISYQPGDALGVWPTQSLTLVEQIIKQLDLDKDEAIALGDVTRPLEEWLRHHRELTVLTRPFLTAHAQRSGSTELSALLEQGNAEALRDLLENRQLIDVLHTWPAAWSAQDLVAALRPLTPRMYSIASSRQAVDDEVHLTLAHVHYTREDQARWGVASHFLAELGEGETVPVFVEENDRFRLPTDTARDIIMIGPGTGIAPFRAFIQERSAMGATGRNWLFFGNPCFDSDFLYQTEWLRALQEGSLYRLDVAFSRDQPEKIYVQHRLQEHARDLYEWIQGGAYVYVCGDATRMAKDVQQTLLSIAQAQGGLDAEQAKAWLDQLAAQGRYARDVY